MSKSVPFPSPAPPGGGSCGMLARFFWAGEYEAPCILRSGHDGNVHWDGITFSEDPETAEK